LKKAAANYASLSKTSYDFLEVEVREYLGSMNHRSERRLRIVGSGGRYREETLPAGTLYLFDGQNRWAYNPDRNEYTKGAASAGQPASLATVETAFYGVKSARLLGQDTLQLDTGPVVCQIIEADKGSATGAAPVQYSHWTYWIDAGRNLVLKLSYHTTSRLSNSSSPVESAETFSFAKAAVGEGVDETLLQFRPPEGAVQVEGLTFEPKSPLVGTVSPEFVVKAGDGTSISGASLRGRVVLLQFADPVDDALFPLEMMYRSLKDHGLAAFCVLPPHAGNKIDGSYTVPVASDSDGKLAKQFGVANRTIVMIDRSGKIAYVGSTISASGELAQALKSAGAW
jgi:outer membrane lipoprotein-sorting protein